MEWLLDLDTQLLLAINGWHSPVADKVMLFFSDIPVWIPLYVAIAALFFYPKWQSVRSEYTVFWFTGLMSVCAAAICFGLCDQVSVFIKESIGRFRPGHQPHLEAFVRLLEGEGSSYGFVSSHAANTFGLATLTSLIFRKKPFAVVIFTWAAVVSYSRVYLAKHYPLDVICGAFLGIALAISVYQVWKYALLKYEMYRRQRA